jgi:hypothetical protein
MTDLLCIPVSMTFVGRNSSPHSRDGEIHPRSSHYTRRNGTDQFCQTMLWHAEQQDEQKTEVLYNMRVGLL